MNRLRRYIVEQCEKRDLSYRQASIRAGLDHTAISRHVHGARHNRKGIAKPADLFGVPLPQMLALARYTIPPECFTLETELEWQLLERFRTLTPQQQRYEIALLNLHIEHGVLRKPRVIGEEEAQEEAS